MDLMTFFVRLILEQKKIWNLRWIGKILYLPPSTVSHCDVPVRIDIEISIEPLPIVGAKTFIPH